MSLELRITEPVAGSGTAQAAVRPATSARSPLARTISQCLAAILVAFASYFCFSQFIVQTVQVVGGSMRPTLQNSDRYLLNRWIYHVRLPRRGEIVVLRDPADGGRSVKRIVGVPGDEVLIRGGRVFLNGRLYSEGYLPPDALTFPEGGGAKEQRLKCGPREYAVLGDNRRCSADSRSYGAVRKNALLGMLIH